MGAVDRSRQLAVAAQALTAGYYAAIEWIDLFPWNNVSDGNGQERFDAVAAALQVGVLAGFALDRRRLMAVGTGAYAAWLAAQVASSWRPARGPRRCDADRYALTTAVLPRSDRSGRPDAAHLVLQALTALSVVTSVRALRRTAR